MTVRGGINPYAPPAYNGLGQQQVPSGYRDNAFDYVFNASLTANQTIRQQVSIHNDSDFHWRALVLGLATGTFTVLLSDSDWYELSSAPIASQNLIGDAASPLAIFPEIVLPAGGRIGVDMTDTSGAPNTVQLLFRGVKRYYMGAL